MTATQRYIQPGWFTRNIFNPLVRRFARWGVSYRGTRELAGVGRTSGQVRTTVVNLLDLEGRQYLVAPRGNTQWVRNVRAAGRAELRLRPRGRGRAAARPAGRGRGAGRAHRRREASGDQGVPASLEEGGRHVLRGHRRERDRRAGAGDRAGLPGVRAAAGPLTPKGRRGHCWGLVLGSSMYASALAFACAI